MDPRRIAYTETFSIGLFLAATTERFALIGLSTIWNTVSMELTHDMIPFVV